MTLDLVLAAVVGFAFGQLMARNAQTRMLVDAAKEWRDNLLSRLDNGEEYHAGVHCSGYGPDGGDDFGDDDDDDDDDVPASDMPTGGRFVESPGDQWKNN